ncbi:DUF4232 domain-containing protein [Streptomyces sp. SS1-1]|uniref:DUF4232 domain-containing protein n=1 Tax=Streptomyces sp. SS1-1 TaxID=2651869 RepID=UPI001250A3A2|nr:DUF4232 domain-containing protein [Streptomyces sp. SS1-1]KAB2974006.1 DUF4232 domain-containing protein [Streptomyces sp. SS1-1]
MRTISVTATVAALAAALLLTSCDSAGDDKDTQDKAGGAGCVADLAVRFGPANAAPAAGDTGNVPVTVTNRGDAPCTVEGLPGVDLVAGDTTAAVPAADAASAGKATFAKGASLAFTLTYVRGEEGGDGSLAARSATVRLPGADRSESFEWAYGAVALKDDGRTPDASVTGFQQSTD